MRRSLLVLAILGTLGFWATAQTPVKFTLDWAYQGPQAPFLVALYKGYFAAEGLDVSLDRGYGSADAVTKIATGVYDLGFADINSMIEFNVRNPERALLAVAIVYDYAPFSIVTLRGRGIEKPQDLVGRTLGAPAGDASRRLFPVFAKVTGIDPTAVNWVTMEPGLRERLLVLGQVDAISAHFFTAVLNLKAMGVPEEDIVVLLYAKHGLDLYGNAVMCSPKLLQDKPEVVRAFLRALTKAWHDTLANPEEAIAYVKQRDPLIDPAVELERLRLAINVCMLTPDVLERGFGDARPERLAKAIALVVEGFGLAYTPKVEEVFTSAYLPPLAERLPRQ
ncbi:MAG: ABC transporter substrate-binding protein [Candidatus Bipolaricaulaceae bacterium]